MLLAVNVETVQACFVDWRQSSSKVTRTIEIDIAQAKTVFPELEVSPSEFKQCWDDWARARRIPIEDYPEVALALDCQNLQVEPDPKLSAWLREHRTDVYERETWLWLGEGELRQPVRLALKASDSDQ